MYLYSPPPAPPLVCSQIYADKRTDPDLDAYASICKLMHTYTLAFFLSNMHTCIHTQFFFFVCVVFRSDLLRQTECAQHPHIHILTYTHTQMHTYARTCIYTYMYAGIFTYTHRFTRVSFFLFCTDLRRQAERP